MGFSSLRLKSIRLYVSVFKDLIIVYGDTYYVKDVLKKYGFKYKSNYWFLRVHDIGVVYNNVKVMSRVLDPVNLEKYVVLARRRIVEIVVDKLSGLFNEVKDFAVFEAGVYTDGYGFGLDVNRDVVVELYRGFDRKNG